MPFRGIVKKSRSDMTDYMQKDNWYIGKLYAKYGGISFSNGIYTPNPRKLWQFSLFEISYFTMLLGEYNFRSFFI